MDSFKEDVGKAVTYLDKIVDVNLNRHPLQEQRDNSFNYRNIGLGVFGYASMLMKLNMKYGSNDAIYFSDTLFDEMFRAAVTHSSNLAGWFGTFPKYNDAVWKSNIIKAHFTEKEIDKLRENGLRNCSLLSIAPTGSLATMLGETGGIEPEFSLKYTRKTVGMTDNDETYYEMHCKTAQEYIDMYGTEELPEWFVSSADIKPLERILTQSIIQDHIDTGISSTINLPNTATKEDVMNIFVEAWKHNLKGITVFRNGCKRAGVLTNGGGKEESAEPTEKPADNNGRGYIRKVDNNSIGLERHLNTGCGTLHCSAFFDKTTGDLLETYLSKGSKGGCLSSLSGLSRMISVAARGGISVADIVDQLKSSIQCPSYSVRSAVHKDTSIGNCCPAAVGNAIEDMYNEIMSIVGKQEKSKPVATVCKKEKTVDDIEKCPICGEQIVHENGCVSCKSCWWSKC